VRRAGAALALAALAAAGAAAWPSGGPPEPAAAAAPPPLKAPRLAAVRSFAFAIGDGTLGRGAAGRLGRYGLAVVDGEAAPAGLVAALRARGTLVLGYLSVGTIERGRPWTRAAWPYRLEYWPDWGEHYADAARAGFRRLITGRVAPALLTKGFDGLFLDNVDMVAAHPRQLDGMLALVKALGAAVHARGGLLFAQNGEDVLAPFAPVLDGWNREDVTSTYDFDRRRYVRQTPADVRAAQSALARWRRAGLLVTATDYVAGGDGSGAARAASRACAAGALPFVSDIGLRRLPAAPLTCL
jgi:hypothetical protein